MTLAIMQPYLFPYIGYFQMMSAVDAFLVLDEVAYIRRGWINRNRLKCGDRIQMFTVPVRKGPVGQPIRETLISGPPYVAWRRKFFCLLAQHYHKAPCYKPILTMLEKLFPAQREDGIGKLARESLLATHAYLGLKTRIIATDAAHDSNPFHGQARIIALCRQEKATTYINLPGGAALYSKEVMAASGIQLQFIQPRLEPYPQQGPGPFLPGLSMLDVLMNNPVEEIHRLLSTYDLQ